MRANLSSGCSAPTRRFAQRIAALQNMTSLADAIARKKVHGRNAQGHELRGTEIPAVIVTVQVKVLLFVSDDCQAMVQEPG